MATRQPPGPTVNIGLRGPEDLKQWLDAVAATLGMKRNNLVVRMLEREMDLANESVPVWSGELTDQPDQARLIEGDAVT